MPLLKRYGWIILLVMLGILIVLTKQTDSVEVKNLDEAISRSPTEVNQSTVKQENEAKVDVKGEVQQPGVYSIQEGMRVDDVITLAGGLTADADPTSVNLALKLQDEMVIIVMKTQEHTENGISKNSDQVAINQATLEEIQSLSGIGPSKATAIIQYREEYGLFKEREDLLNVVGIGERTLEKFSEDIRVP